MKIFGKGGLGVAVAVGFFLTAVAAAYGQTHNGVELVEARLVADSKTVVPGRPVTLGLHLKMEEGWHTYWEYSGDSGLPVTLDLRLPDGFRTTELQWPLPRRMVEPGDMEVYAYKDEVLLLMRLFPPAKMEEGGAIELTGLAEWLVCEAICIPGEAEVSLELMVADELKPANTELFDRFRSQLPEPLRGRPEDPVRVELAREGSRFLARVVEGPDTWEYDYYPLPASNTVLGHPETVSGNGVAAEVRIPIFAAPAGLERLPGVLVAEDPATGERRGWRVR